jgi:hypothetical protein
MRIGRGGMGARHVGQRVEGDAGGDHTHDIDGSKRSRRASAQVCSAGEEAVVEGATLMAVTVAAAEGIAAAAVQRTERRTAGREGTTEQYQMQHEKR